MIAEKIQAMVALGLANSRMKDFYDVWVLSRTHEFDKTRLARAIAATFKRRGTTLPQDLPEVFTPAFFRDEGKLQQWSALVRDLSVEVPSFATVVSDIATFIAPFMNEAAALVRRETGE